MSSNPTNISKYILCASRPQSLWVDCIEYQNDNCLFGNGDLWLHSPIKANEHLFEEVSKMGTVRWLVPPNLFHHISLLSSGV